MPSIYVPQKQRVKNDGLYVIFTNDKLLVVIQRIILYAVFTLYDVLDYRLHTPRSKSIK